MVVLDYVSVAIMIPALLYGAIALYFLASGSLYLLFRKITLKAYKEMLNDLHLSDKFLKDTRKLFWYTYTPLFAVIVIFRIVIPLNSERYDGYLIGAIIGYLLLLLFSGYTSKK